MIENKIEEHKEKFHDRHEDHLREAAEHKHMREHQQHAREAHDGNETGGRGDIEALSAIHQDDDDDASAGGSGEGRQKQVV